MPRILAIFLGKAKTYNEGGVRFTTAISKQPVSGRVQIDQHGLVGNEVANHKNALYAFCTESYSYWSQQWQPAEDLSLLELAEQAGLNPDQLPQWSLRALSGAFVEW